MAQICNPAVPRAGAPLLCIVRYADINVRPDSPAVQRVPGGVQVDVGQVLNQNPPGAYGIIYSELTEFICANGSEVQVPGANPGVETLIRRQVAAHYDRWCTCPPPTEAPLCGQFGGLGGSNNQYGVTISFSGTETREEDGECKDFPLQFEYEIVVWGPIGGGRLEVGNLQDTNCGKAFSYTYWLEVATPTNGCKTFEEVVGFVAGTVRGGQFEVTDIRTIFALFPEQCPPPSCIPRPLPPQPPLPPDTVDEPDEPPLPEGESAVTIVVVEGEDGKDGKNVSLASVRRIPYGTGFSQAVLLAESETERVYELVLEDELEGENVSINVGTCDIVTNEFTSQVVEAVLPIVGGSGGWGSVIAAIASMVFELAKQKCLEESPALVDAYGGEVSGVTQTREIVTANVFSRPERAVYCEIFVLITGTTYVLPTTLDVDTFDSLGSEGVYGVLYVAGAGGAVQAVPHLLRFPFSSINTDWDRFVGVKVALPAGAQYRINFNWKVKPE